MAFLAVTNPFPTQLAGNIVGVRGALREAGFPEEILRAAMQARRSTSGSDLKSKLRELSCRISQIFLGGMK